LIFKTVSLFFEASVATYVKQLFLYMFC